MAEPHDDIELILRFADRQISDGEFDALQQRLAADAAFRHRFIQLQLRAGYIAEAVAPQGAAAKTRTADATARPAVRGFRGFRFPRWSFALAAALLLATCGVAIYLVALTPDARPLTPDTAPVATILETSDGSTLVVNETIAYAGDEVRSGEIALDTGTADFRLTNGVGITLRGDTHLTVHGPMRATMTRGAAAFECPPEAVGYTVELPDGAKVVDLGTAFEVIVDDRGEATVRVTDGLVRYIGAGADADSKIGLAAGDVARRIGDRLVVNDSDLADAMADRVINGDFGSSSAYSGPGVAAGAGVYWNRVAANHADRLLAADGVTATPITVSTSQARFGQRPGQRVPLFDDYVFGFAHEGPLVITIDGLDDGRTYDLLLYAATALGQGAGFAIDGVTRHTSGARTDAFADGVTYVRFSAQRPVDGRIVVTVSEPIKSAHLCSGFQLVADAPFTRLETGLTSDADGIADEPRPQRTPADVPPKTRSHPGDLKGTVK